MRCAPLQVHLMAACILKHCHDKAAGKGYRACRAPPHISVPNVKGCDGTAAHHGISPNVGCTAGGGSPDAKA